MREQKEERETADCLSEVFFFLYSVELGIGSILCCSSSSVTFFAASILLTHMLHKSVLADKLGLRGYE